MVAVAPNVRFHSVMASTPPQASRGSLLSPVGISLFPVEGSSSLFFGVSRVPGRVLMLLPPVVLMMTDLAKVTTTTKMTTTKMMTMTAKMTTTKRMPTKRVAPLGEPSERYLRR